MAESPDATPENVPAEPPEPRWRRRVTVRVMLYGFLVILVIMLLSLMMTSRLIFEGAGRVDRMPAEGDTDVIYVTPTR